MAKEVRRYWCSECNKEYNFPPLIEWRRDEFNVFMFCSRQCANEYRANNPIN